MYTKYIHTNIPQAKETEEGVTSMEEVSKAVKVVQLMKKVMSTIKQRMGNHFKEMNLTGPQGMLMGTLANHGEMKVSDLSEKLGLSNSTVSGILDRLENQGLVERTRSKEDRRVVYVNICPKFNEIHGEIHKLIEENTASIMKKGTHEELNRIVDGLTTLKRLLEE